MTSLRCILVIMFLQKVILKLFINFCLPISLKKTDCCQTERQIQRDAWSSVHTCVVQHCLHANCPQMIEKERRLTGPPDLNWFPWICHVWRAMYESFLQYSSEAKTVSELRVVLEKLWDYFPQVQLTKLLRVLEKDWESTWRLVGHTVEDISSMYCN